MTCTFCAGKSVTTHCVRKRSVENALAEMRMLKTRYGVNDFLVEDENFTAHKPLVMEFCETLLARECGYTWSCPSGVRIDTLDASMLAIMEKAGCHSLSVGIEFGTQRMLDLTRKRLTLEVVREKMAMVKRTGIRTTGFFLFGIPGETEEDMRQTIAFSKTLGLNRAQFNNFMPLPGSEIYRQLKEDGLREIDHKRFFVHDVGYVPPGMTRKTIKNMQRKAYWSFYARPRILMDMFRQTVSLRQFLQLLLRFADSMR